MSELPVMRSPITEELFTRFIIFLDAKPKTVETYTRALRQFFIYLFDRDIHYPQREDILAFRDELRVKHRATTVQSYLTVVRLFFRWAEQEGLYRNIAEHIKGATISKEYKKDYLTSEQIKTILSRIPRDTLSGLRDYALLALMTTGGLRSIEVARANIEDLRAVGNDTVLFIQGKGQDEKTEYVKIQPPVERAIRDWLIARGTPLLKEPLFVSLSNNNRGQRMTTRSISGIVKQHLQQAGFNSEKLTAHSLRHTAVTLALLGGKNLQEVQQFARHSNIATTQVYAHNLDRARNNCEEIIAKAIF